MKHLHRFVQAGLALAMLVLAACAPVAGQALPQEATSAPTQPAPAGTPLPPAAVLAAQQWLANELGVSVEQVVLISQQQAEWTDSCLGLGQPNESCLQAITPGWQAEFTVDGLPYEVRTDETGAVVRVAPPAEASELSGTSWELVSFEAGGVVTSVAAPGSITLDFGPEGQAGGSGGCNSFGGLYRAQDGALRFGRITSTLRACADQDLMGQETQFYEGLQSASGYALAGDTLTITHANGTLTLKARDAGAGPDNGQNEARVPGIIDFYADGTDGVVTAPATVAAGEEFELTLATFGGGCERAGDTSVIITPTGAEVWVYDFTTAVTPESVCDAMLRRLTQTVTLRFDQPGEMLIRIWGRRVGPETPALGEPALIEHTITVQ